MRTEIALHGMRFLSRGPRLRFRVLSTWPGRIGAGLVGAMLALAFLGPFVAPHAAGALVGSEVFSGPSAAFPLGTDVLGRDVLSRLLLGGRNLVILAAIGTVVAYVIGASIGLIAGFSRSILDGVLMRAVDVFFAFPPVLLLLLIAFAFGPGQLTILGIIVLVHAPGVARIIRAATLEVSVRGFIEAAVARGEPLHYILRREILPNIASTVAADAGPRFTGSIFVVAALGFFGLGVPPPAPDWATMIFENRQGFFLNPSSIMVPAALIALLTIGTNTLADTVARGLGKSIDEELVRR